VCICSINVSIILIHTYAYAGSAFDDPALQLAVGLAAVVDEAAVGGAELAVHEEP
jgi:hypothetical protein